MPDGYSYVNIAANGTTVVKSGLGILHAITVNSTGTLNTATVYDNTAGSGSTIATIGTVSQGTIPYDIAFHNGLTVVLAGGVAADVTVSYL